MRDIIGAYDILAEFSFYEIFNSDKCTFYINNPCGSKWIKSSEDDITFFRKTT